MPTSKVIRVNNFIQSLDLDVPSLEGFLFPDTYILLNTYTEDEIIRILVHQYIHTQHQLLKEVKLTQGMNMIEITALASIIQGEAMFKDEMPLISSIK